MLQEEQNLVFSEPVQGVKEDEVKPTKERFFEAFEEDREVDPDA